MWKGSFIGFYIGGSGNIQPPGGLFEFGIEGGGKWLVIDGCFGVGGGSLKVDDKMVEEKLGPNYWGKPYIFNARIGAAIPINLERARLNIGGGFEGLLITIPNHKENENGTKPAGTLDRLFIPYVGARLDFALSQRGGVLGFIGYNCEFTPADKMEIYFGEPVSLRHTILAGFVFRGRF